MTRSPGLLSTGTDSPVTSDSSTEDAPTRTRPSTGTASPGLTRSRSPTSTSERSTSVSTPLRRRRASSGARSRSLRIAAGRPAPRARLQVAAEQDERDDDADGLVIDVRRLRRRRRPSGRASSPAERRKAAVVPRPTSVSMLAVRCWSVRIMPGEKRPAAVEVHGQREEREGRRRRPGSGCPPSRSRAPGASAPRREPSAGHGPAARGPIGSSAARGLFLTRGTRLVAGRAHGPRSGGAGSGPARAICALTRREVDGSLGDACRPRTSGPRWSRTHEAQCIPSIGEATREIVGGVGAGTPVARRDALDRRLPQERRLRRPLISKSGGCLPLPARGFGLRLQWVGGPLPSVGRLRQPRAATGARERPTGGVEETFCPRRHQRPERYLDSSAGIPAACLEVLRIPSNASAHPFAQK